MIVIFATQILIYITFILRKMKQLLTKTVFISAFLLSFIAVNQQAQGQTAKPTYYDELILHFPDVGLERELPLIKASVAALPGVVWAGECKTMKCVMLKVDRSLHIENTLVATTIHQTTGFDFIDKPGVTFTDINNLCED